MGFQDNSAILLRNFFINRFYIVAKYHKFCKRPANAFRRYVTIQKKAVSRQPLFIYKPIIITFIACVIITIYVFEWFTNMCNIL